MTATDTASPFGAPLAGVVPSIMSEPRNASVVAPLADWHSGAGQSSVARHRVSTAPTVTSITTGANEADAQNYTEVVSTASTFTPAMKVVLILLSTQNARSTPSDLGGALIAAANRAIAAQVDSDLCDLASTMTSGYNGTGVPLTVAGIREAQTAFSVAALGGQDPAAIVLSPKQYGDALGDAISSQGGMFVQSGVLAAFTSMSEAQAISNKGVLFGAQVFVTDEVQSSGGDRYGFITRAAMGSDDIGAGLGGAMDFISAPKVFDQLVNGRAASSIALDARYGVAIENPNLCRSIRSVA